MVDQVFDLLDEPHDERSRALPPLLDAAILRRLCQLSPLRSTLHIGLEWGAIGVAVWLGLRLESALLYPLLVCFIGARQHALVVLMHEGAHQRLFHRRALNDWVSELLLAWPFLLFTMHAYRRNHWPHHRFTNGPGDPDLARKQTPDWRFPRTAASLGGQLCSYALGLGFLHFMVTAARLPKPSSARDRAPLTLRAGRIVFLVTLALTLTALQGWTAFLLYWVVPFVTWFQTAFLIRSIAEHFAIQGRTGTFARTRTTLPTVLGRLFVVPKNAGYHLEHHLYPGVPFFNLPRLHAALMTRVEFRDGAHLTRGYWNVLRECTRAESDDTRVRHPA